TDKCGRIPIFPGERPCGLELVSGRRRKTAFHIQLVPFINGRMDLIMRVDFFGTVPTEPCNAEIPVWDTQKHTMFVIRTGSEYVKFFGKPQAPSVIRHGSQVFEIRHPFSDIGMETVNPLSERGPFTSEGTLKTRI